MNDKSAIIGLVVVVVICIAGFMLYNYQMQQAALARQVNPRQQLASGIGNTIGGIIGLAEGQ